MLQCATTLCAGRARRRDARKPGAGSAPGVPVCVASISTLSGNAIVALDVRSRRVDRAANRRELRRARREQPRHVDDGGAVRAVRIDVEDGDDRTVIRVLYRAKHRRAAVGRDRVRRRAENDRDCRSAPSAACARRTGRRRIRRTRRRVPASDSPPAARASRPTTSSSLLSSFAGISNSSRSPTRCTMSIATPRLRVWRDHSAVRAHAAAGGGSAGRRGPDSSQGSLRGARVPRVGPAFPRPRSAGAGWRESGRGCGADDGLACRASRGGQHGRGEKMRRVMSERSEGKT